MHHHHNPEYHRYGADEHTDARNLHAYEYGNHGTAHHHHGPDRALLIHNHEDEYGDGDEHRHLVFTGEQDDEYGPAEHIHHSS